MPITNFKEMPARQKLVIVGIIIVILIILWQVLGLFGGSSAPRITPTPRPITRAPATISASSPTAGQTHVYTPSTSNLSGGAGVQQPYLPNNYQFQPRETAIPSIEMDLIKQQTQTQATYINNINQLQLLKIQRDIAETNQAIAAAKLATVSSEKKLTDVLTSRPANAITPIPASNYGPSLVTPFPSGQSITTPQTNNQSTSASNVLNASSTTSTTTTTTTPEFPREVAPLPVTTPDEPYVVVSVTMQLDRWHAVLGLGGKLYNVTIGDILPPDNSIVVAIGRQGVILQKANKRRRLSLVPVI